MTIQENQEAQNQHQQVSDKELNFRALEAKYQREIELERNARLQAEQIAQHRMREDEDEDESEPYVDTKKLNKKLNRFSETNQSQINKAMDRAKLSAKEELRQELWLEHNTDFDEILQHAEKFANAHPQLAKSILKMPEGFERQKLVYQSIKDLGINREKEKEQSIQEKIDANRKSPFYQASGVGTSPYSSQGDFSQSGQQQAYNKMQELKNRLRL